MDANISQLTNPAYKVSLTTTIGELLTGGPINILNLLFFFVGLIFFLNLVSAGWEYMSGSGDPKKIAAATTRLINNLLGVALAFGSFLIVKLVTTIIGASSVSPF